MTLRPLFGAALGIVTLAALASPAGAETMRGRAKAVVELFTSQGCAQCPPADALLTGLAEEGDVVERPVAQAEQSLAGTDQGIWHVILPRGLGTHGRWNRSRPVWSARRRG